MNAHEFLESKIGHFNSSHPFLEKDVDYEDVINWLNEFADQSMLPLEFIKKFFSLSDDGIKQLQDAYKRYRQ